MDLNNQVMKSHPPSSVIVIHGATHGATHRSQATGDVTQVQMNLKEHNCNVLHSYKCNTKCNMQVTNTTSVTPNATCGSACADLTNQLECCWVDPASAWKKHLTCFFDLKSSMAKSLPVENLLPQNVGSIINYLQ